jgi:two-component sensor histidine kinase
LQKQGEINVRFTEKLESYVPTVIDDGIGLPEGFDPVPASSFGYTIDYGLAQQLDGKAMFSGEKGTAFTFSFPKACV